MNKCVNIIVFFLLILIAQNSVFAQQNFYDINTVQKIEVFISQNNWDFKMDTAKYGAETYLMADSVLVNGVRFDSAGIKYKGNSSYDSTKLKNPVHIALDEFKNQSYQTYTDIKLSNCYQDPSMIREVLSYDILKNYMYCPKSNFAKLYINNSYIGLYSNDESINKTFCSNNFNSSQNIFVKCNPIILPGPTTKSNLKFINPDSSSYLNFYEIKSSYGWKELIKLCDSVTNNQNSIANVFNIDRVLWMLAFNNVLVNLDSYSGVFCQNYYLYKDNNGKYNPIIWDLNMCFGGFPFAGSGATGMGSMTISNLQQLSLNLHNGDANWPLISGILNNAHLKKAYIAHMKTIVNEFFSNNLYQTRASQLQSIIDTAVLYDQNKFFTYSQFQNSLTNNVVAGSYSVPGISNLMNSRVSYLQSTAEFVYSQPLISNVQSSNNLPALNSNVSITANISGATTAYLNYRFDATSVFQKIAMYDDGLHNDGLANDNIYGASFVMLSAIANYYIYAENTNAAVFSPERAEHEFYTLQANVASINIGDVVINEFLAANKSNVMNELGQFADWIELYNNTNNTIDLYGLYLSDNYLNRTKFSFPANSVILPHNFLIVWADENITNAANIHANFKLSASGEQLILSNSSGIVLDSLSFGVQTDDVSFARCPDGSGSFALKFPPTFNAFNCNIGIESESKSQLLIYPNPAIDKVIIYCPEFNGQIINISDITAKLLYTANLTSSEFVLNTNSWKAGVYFVKVGSLSKKLIINK